MPYKVIVVGTDGSERAGHAFRKALLLSKLAGASLHVVQAVPEAVHGFADSTAGAVAVSEARGDYERTGERLTTEGEGEGVSIQVHNPGSADPADALLAIADEVGAELIVVGNKGMSGVSRFLQGSVPNKVSHRAEVDVLIVDTSED